MHTGAVDAMRTSTYWVLIALAGGARHGYALMEEVSRLTDGRTLLRVATLYPALDRLVEEGLIDPAGDEVVAGRRRRYFRLSPKGAAALDAEATRLAAEADRARSRLRLFHGGTADLGGGLA